MSSAIGEVAFQTVPSSAAGTSQGWALSDCPDRARRSFYFIKREGLVTTWSEDRFFARLMSGGASRRAAKNARDGQNCCEPDTYLTRP